MQGIILGVAVTALLVAIPALVVAVVAYMRANSASDKADVAYATLRERISKLVKDINSVNELEYNVDVQQQDKLNELLAPKSS